MLATILANSAKRLSGNHFPAIFSLYSTLWGLVSGCLKRSPLSLWNQTLYSRNSTTDHKFHNDHLNMKQVAPPNIQIVISAICFETTSKTTLSNLPYSEILPSVTHYCRMCFHNIVRLSIHQNSFFHKTRTPALMAGEQGLLFCLSIRRRLLSVNEVEVIKCFLFHFLFVHHL